MVGADESTELWRHPNLTIFLRSDLFNLFKFIRTLISRPWFHDAFLHGNLFGESACIGLGELTTITSDPEKPVLDLSEVKPNGTELNLGPAPRQTFPLVLCGLAKQDQGFEFLQLRLGL